MTPQVTEEQLKSLKLFSHYCRSYGADEVDYTYYLENCTIDWEDDSFSARPIRNSIEGYERIFEVLTEICDTNNLYEFQEDCDNRASLTLHIDCIERTLTASATEWFYGTEPRGESKELTDIAEEYGEETYNEILSLFEKIGEGNQGDAEFNGGGDSGQLEGYISINGSNENLSEIMEDFLYNWLNSSYSGWENNEGAQGTFIFIPSDNMIELDFNYNTEEEQTVPMNFEVKF